MILQKMIRISLLRFNMRVKGANIIIGGNVIVSMVGHFRFMFMLTNMKKKKTLKSLFKSCLRNENIQNMDIITGAHPSNLIKRRDRRSVTTKPKQL